MRSAIALLCSLVMLTGHAVAEEPDDSTGLPGFVSLDSARKMQAEKSAAGVSEFVPLRPPGSIKAVPARTIYKEAWPQAAANAKPSTHKMTPEQAQQILSLFADAD